MARYRSTRPYWLKVKFGGECSQCHAPIKPGENVFYYPNDRSLLCNKEECGQKASRELAADDFDQAQYQSQY